MRAETKYQNTIIQRGDYEIKTKTQVGNLVIYDDDFKSNTVGLTRNGDLLASEYALSILKENQISNFTIRPVDQRRGDFSKKYAPDVKCFQLIVSNEMPPASPPTIINIDSSKRYIALKNYKLYYHKSVMENVFDLNRTYEYFGADWFISSNNYHSQYIIVTQKVKDIFIHQLGQNEWDFKTVYLTDDDGNIIKDYKKE